MWLALKGPFPSKEVSLNLFQPQINLPWNDKERQEVNC